MHRITVMEYANRNSKTELVALLLDHKNKNFPATGAVAFDLTIDN
ncbi:MAG: hypothetical protein AB9897_05870 [Anaerolineaceae bacterium]